jgi:hypothetical protein
MSSHLLQVFLSYRGNNPGIFEVLVSKEDNELTCTCPGFNVKGDCKHVQTVETRIGNNGGIYPFKFLGTVKENDLKAAMETEILFREFVIKNTKIEVI